MSFPRLTDRRVVLFVGHYGSGKTNIAVNYAMALAGAGEDVTIADMDIVNPYFRTQDSADELTAAGIRVVASPYAGTNLDAPAMPGAFYGLFEDRSRRVILDIGGDDRGAVALGRYAGMIREENNFEMIFVANAYRALTPEPEDAAEVLREIEAACGLPVTAIVNNSHLGNLTEVATVTDSLPFAQKLAKLCDLPLLGTCVRHDLCGAVSEKLPAEIIFPLALQKKYYEPEVI